MRVVSEQETVTGCFRIEGRAGVTSALELKTQLLEGLASGTDLELDLADAREIDVTILQLLYAASREAERAGTEIMVRASQTVAEEMRRAGFPPSAESYNAE